MTSGRIQPSNLLALPICMFMWTSSAAGVGASSENALTSVDASRLVEMMRGASLEMIYRYPCSTALQWYDKRYEDLIEAGDILGAAIWLALRSEIGGAALAVGESGAEFEGRFRDRCRASDTWRRALQNVIDAP
jgi:hypothetical protein